MKESFLKYYPVVKGLKNKSWKALEKGKKPKAREVFILYL